MNVLGLEKLGQFKNTIFAQKMQEKCQFFGLSSYIEASTCITGTRVDRLDIESYFLSQKVVHDI